MLHSIKRLYGKHLGALDDKVGYAEDCYFDDTTWAVRYFVVDTDWWTYPRRLLLSPHAFGPIPEHGNVLPVNLTREQIEKSPTLEWEGQVTRQFETEYYQYYGWPFYWQGGFLWGPSSVPKAKPSNGSAKPKQAAAVDGSSQKELTANQNLRSARLLFGFHIYSGDESDGRVTDLLMEEKTWRICYLVLDAGHWYSRKEILISTRKIQSVDWTRGWITIKATKAEVERATWRPVPHGHATVREPGVPVS